MKVLILVILNTLMWIINSVSFWQMTVLIRNQTFLLWFTLVPYIVILCPLLLFQRFRQPSKIQANSTKIHLIYIAYAVLSTADSLLEFYAGPFVGGIIQAILSAAIPLPVMGLLAYFVMKQTFGFWQILGSGMVIVASIIQISSSSGLFYTSIGWVFGFAGGLIIGCIYTLFWEVAFTWYEADPLPLMIWSTLYSIPIYGLMVVISDNWVAELEGLDCFFHVGNYTQSDSSCSPYAWISITVYSLSSIASDVIQIYLVAQDTAFFLIIADALATPVIALVFALPLFGKNTEPFTWQSIVAVVLIVAGMFVYKYLELQKHIRGLSCCK